MQTYWVHSANPLTQLALDCSQLDEQFLGASEVIQALSTLPVAHRRAAEPPVQIGHVVVGEEQGFGVACVLVAADPTKLPALLLEELVAQFRDGRAAFNRVAQPGAIELWSFGKPDAPRLAAAAAVVNAAWGWDEAPVAAVRFRQLDNSQLVASGSVSLRSGRPCWSADVSLALP